MWVTNSIPSHQVYYDTISLFPLAPSLSVSLSETHTCPGCHVVGQTGTDIAEFHAA